MVDNVDVVVIGMSPGGGAAAARLGKARWAVGGAWLLREDARSRRGYSALAGVRSN